MRNPPSRFVCVLGIAAAVALLLGIAAFIAVKALLKPERAGAALARAASRALGREVRLRTARLSLLKGIVLEGLEVAEQGGFAKGVFAEVESFQLRVQWRPLLERRIVVDKVAIEGVSLRLERAQDGTLSVADLIERGAAAPAKPAPGKGAISKEPPPEESPLELAVEQATLAGGRLAYRDQAAGLQLTISEIKAESESVGLERPFPLRLSMQAEGKVPAPLKARLAYAGTIDLSAGVEAAKATFDSLSVDALGFKVSAAGEASRTKNGAKAAFKSLTAAGPKIKASASLTAEAAGDRLVLDIRRLEADMAGLAATAQGRAEQTPKGFSLKIPKGTLAGADFELSAEMRGQPKNPALQVEGRISKLDAAALMAAAQAAAGEPDPAAKTKTADSATPPKAIPLNSKGKFLAGEFAYGKVSAQDLKLNWDLSGITPDFKALGGRAELRAGSGTFKFGGQERSRGLVRVLLLPLTLVKNILTLGGNLRVLPDPDKLLFEEVRGDYTFSAGVMTLHDFSLRSPATNMKALGTIDLARETLDLRVTATLAKLAPIVVDVGGTFDDPKTRLRLDKILTKPIEKLAEPALNILKGLFKKN